MTDVAQLIGIESGVDLEVRLDVHCWRCRKHAIFRTDEKFREFLSEHEHPEPESQVSMETMTVAQALREWRREEAARRNMKAFQIFSNRTLEALAEDEPQTWDELRGVPGIGPKTLRRFGVEILDVIASNM